jgi:hypothetical protein
MARRPAVRWLLFSGLAAIAIVAAAVLSVPLWITPFIARRASATLAHPVTIGHLGLHLRHPTMVTLEDVVVGNPDSFTPDEEPLARIPRLTVRIDAAASVLRRTLVIASAEIDRPEVRVIGTEDGRENYDLPSASQAPIGALSILSGHARVSLAGLHADFDVTFGTEQADATRFVADAQGFYASEPVTARFAGDLPTSAQDPSQDWPVEITIKMDQRRPPRREPCKIRPIPATPLWTSRSPGPTWRGLRR